MRWPRSLLLVLPVVAVACGRSELDTTIAGLATDVNRVDLVVPTADSTPEITNLTAGEPGMYAPGVTGVATPRVSRESP
ncbi:MAG: hypothetical protein ACE5GB_06925 [Acidimicrobiales bacterium]